MHDEKSLSELFDEAGRNMVAEERQKAALRQAQEQERTVLAQYRTLAPLFDIDDTRPGEERIRIALRQAQKEKDDMAERNKVHDKIDDVLSFLSDEEQIEFTADLEEVCDEVKEGKTRWYEVQVETNASPDPIYVRRSCEPSRAYASDPATRNRYDMEWIESVIRGNGLTCDEGEDGWQTFVSPTDITRISIRPVKARGEA